MIGGTISKAIENLGQTAKEFFTEIRLFTRGKADNAVKRKKELSQKLHATVKKMQKLVSENLSRLPKKIREKIQSKVDLYKLIQDQTIQWVKTGKHPANKLISLWNLEARAITRNNAAKMVEFGRRWIVTRLLGGYVIGSPCQKLGGDGDKNHEIIAAAGVVNDCIFLKGRGEKMDVSPEVFEMARRERALSEASIATVKHNKYGFNKPRARSADSCAIKGQAAFLGFNINHLTVDIQSLWGLAQEIT